MAEQGWREGGGRGGEGGVISWYGAKIERHCGTPVRQTSEWGRDDFVLFPSPDVSDSTTKKKKFIRHPSLHDVPINHSSLRRTTRTERSDPPDDSLGRNNHSSVLLLYNYMVCCS